MDTCTIFAIVGWVMAGMFMVFMLLAISKLDDYRVDSEVLRRLSQRYKLDEFIHIDTGRSSEDGNCNNG